MVVRSRGNASRRATSMAASAPTGYLPSSIIRLILSSNSCSPEFKAIPALAHSAVLHLPEPRHFSTPAKLCVLRRRGCWPFCHVDVVSSRSSRRRVECVVLGDRNVVVPYCFVPSCLRGFVLSCYRLRPTSHELTTPASRAPIRSRRNLRGRCRRDGWAPARRRCRW